MLKIAHQASPPGVFQRFHRQAGNGGSKLIWFAADNDHLQCAPYSIKRSGFLTQIYALALPFFSLINTKEDCAINCTHCF